MKKNKTIIDLNRKILSKEMKKIRNYLKAIFLLKEIIRKNMKYRIQKVLLTQWN
jgi:hypothetical protein